MFRSAPLILIALNVLVAACGNSGAGTATTNEQGSSTAAPASTATTSKPVGDLADPSLGKTTFYVYESYLSPSQQPGEETDAPKLTAKVFGLESTAPSVPRDQRKSVGHGRIRFARDLSRALVDVAIAGVNPADIIMFHVHCGPPGALGPIVVDFSEFGDLTKTMAGNTLSIELANKNITYIKEMPRSLKPALPESCPAEPGFPTQTMTIAGMEYLARKGVLYFNLHTKAHTYYGEMRGQIYQATE